MVKRNSLKLNAILNGLKQCLGIIFPLITFPYVSRTLGNYGFGQYSFSWSVVSYFVLIAGLGLSTYAIREGARIRNDRILINRFCSECFTVNCVTTGLSFISLIILTAISTKIHSYFLLILIQSSALVLNLVGRDWINSIYEDYFYLTVRYLIIQIISLVLMFVLIKTPNDVWIYCLISIFASFGGNIPNIFYVKKYVNTKVVRNPNFKKHLPPMLVLFVTQIAITVYVNSDITMLGFFTDDSTVGIYSLASKIYSMIKTVVNAMVMVTLPRMTFIIEHSPEEYEITLKKVGSYLIIILLPMACGLFMLSPEVILIAGGKTYLTGTSALKILSAAMIFAVLGSFCMNSILIANRKEKDCLKATVISAIVNVGLNFGALPLWGMTGAAITTIIAECVNLALLLISSKKIINITIFDKVNILQCTSGCVGIVVACFLIKMFAFNTIISFLISFILSVIVYFLILLCLKNRYIKDLWYMTLKRVFARRFQ